MSGQPGSSSSSGGRDLGPVDEAQPHRAGRGRAGRRRDRGGGQRQRRLAGRPALLHVDDRAAAALQRADAHQPDAEPRLEQPLLARTKLGLRDHVRRVHRAARAEAPVVDLAQALGDREAHLDLLVERGVEADVAEVAVDLALHGVDRADRELGDPTARAEHVPAHLEQAGGRRVQEGDQRLAPLEAPAVGQLERAHLQHLVVRRALEVLAQRRAQLRADAGARPAGPTRRRPRAAAAAGRRPARRSAGARPARARRRPGRERGGRPARAGSARSCGTGRRRPGSCAARRPGARSARRGRCAARRRPTRRPRCRRRRSGLARRSRGRSGTGRGRAAPRSSRARPSSGAAPRTRRGARPSARSARPAASAARARSVTRRGAEIGTTWFRNASSDEPGRVLADQRASRRSRAASARRS